MNPLQRFLHQPRKLFVRRAIFQLHLWVGIAIGLYMVIIGITGSVLVFRQELALLDLPRAWRQADVATPVSAGTVVARLTAAYPDHRIVSLAAPAAFTPVFVATLSGSAGRVSVAADPATGEILGPMPRPAAWLSVIRRLHETLLIRGTGRVWNGVGAAVLLFLAATGLVNWWPGIRHWRRALKVDSRRGWRRINFDLHSAAGFWTLLLLSSWAVTGMYFAWPQPISQWVNSWSPIVSARPPAVSVQPVSSAAPVPDLDTLIARASSIDPGTTLSSIFFPYSRQAPLQIIMRRPGGDGRQYEDTVYFNPYTGDHLTTWRYGVNQSVGDWLIWLQIPLHFGTSWGLAVKILWAVVGLVLPLLAVTGLVMYWNRVLRHRWKRLRAAPTASPTRTKSALGSRL
jgi:uncharacterized iron-regulated membrane protein